MKIRTVFFILLASTVLAFPWQLASMGAALEVPPATILPTSIPISQRPLYKRIEGNSNFTSGVPVRGTTGDNWADIIIGQPDFSQITPNEVVGNKLFNPGGVYVDRTVQPNRVYVYDAGNSRILGLSHLGTAQGGPEAGQPCTSNSDHPASVCLIDETRSADIVLGQSSFISSPCNGDSAFQNYPNSPLPSNSTLCGLRPSAVSILEGGSMATMATDSQGNFYFPDLFNNRVLRYNSPFTTDTIADSVWGQANFASSDCNRGASYGQPDNKSLCLAPPPGYGNVKTGVAIDSQGNLWVADTQNNRVLRFPFNFALGEPAQNADLVLGQPNFSTATSGTGLNQMSSPASVRVDNSGTVYVADGVLGAGTNGRVLMFHPPLSNGMSANQVIQSGLGEPTALEFDPGGGLWVNDSDKLRLLRFVNGTLQQTVNGVPTGIYGGLGIDRDNSILVTGWDPQQVLVYTPPTYTWTSTFLHADEYGPFNQLGPRGVVDPIGLEVVAGQLMIADNQRLLFWNTPWNLANYQPADGVVGQPDFYTRPRWDPAFGRMREDNRGRLWVIKGYNFGSGVPAQIIAYQLPLKMGATPVFTIASPLPLKGGGTFTWTWSLIISGLAYQSSCDCLWASDRDNNRVFRIRNVSTSPVVDIVLGQTNLSGTHCNQGRDSDNQYVHPSSPSRDSLCSPGGLAFDQLGNLYVADHNLELAGNWRLLEFDANTIPNTPASVVFGIPASRVFGRNGSFTEPNCIPGDPMCGPWEPTFDSNNQMVIGFNGYLGPNFPQIYQNPLTNPLPTDALNDFYSHAYSTRFDQFDNLYILDHTRNRVLIYWDHFVPTYFITGTVRTNTGNAVPNVQVDTVGYAASGISSSSGAYTLSGLVTGTYTVIPTRGNCIFIPPTRNVSIPNSSGEQDFIADCSTANLYLPLIQKH